MKNKFVFWLLPVGLLSVVLMLAACGQTTEPNDGIKIIPHDLELGSANCIVCHTGGLRAVPADHTADEYPSETCTLPACHVVSGASAPPIPTITTHDITGAYTNCLACHDVNKMYEFPAVAEHTISANNICLKCHEVSGG